MEGTFPVVPGYQILGVLGRGGMGIVYKARQAGLNRLVALKMILAGSHAGQQSLGRFQAEAVALARLQHPHIVQVYEVGEAEGRPFFVLELVEGGTLEQQLHGEPQPPREAARLVMLLARAVQAAHRKQIVHRDLKPGNVLLAPATDEPALNTAYGCPKITDFGLAKHLGAGQTQTQAGVILGTPRYMAPEQACGKVMEVGPSADIYALGAILYELLTGGPPFHGASPLETLMGVLNQEPVPPSQLAPGVPPDLETICLKCLQKAPANRYVSAGALAADLADFLAGKAIPERTRPPLPGRMRTWVGKSPTMITALGITLAAILGGGGWWLYHNSRDANSQPSHSSKAGDETKDKSEDRKKAQDYVARGFAFSATRDYGRAIAEYDQAILLDPKDATARLRRGDAYFLQGNLEKALTDFSAAIRLDPSNYLGHKYRGWTYFVQGKHEKALADMNVAIRHNPTFYASYLDRANLYAKNGEHDKAVADFRKVLGMNHPVDDSLRETILVGTFFYNRNDSETCYWIYRDMLTALKPLLDEHPELQKAIAIALADAELKTDARARAYALRYMMDDVLKPKLKLKTKGRGDK